MEPGAELLDAARRAGVEADAPCGGKGTCGNCAVRIASGRVMTESAGVLTEAEVTDGFVLACRACIGDEDVTIEVQDRAGRGSGQFGNGEDMALIDPVLLPQPADIRPLSKKITLSVPPAQKSDGLSDLDRFRQSLQPELGAPDIHCGLPVLRQLGDALRADHGDVTVTFCEIHPCSQPHPHPDPPLEGEGINGLPLTRGADNPPRLRLPQGEGDAPIPPVSQGEGNAPTFPAPQGEDNAPTFPAPQGEDNAPIPPLPQGEGWGEGGVSSLILSQESPLHPAWKSVRVTAVEAGDTRASHYGAAIDVGTTTVAVQLADLVDGNILDTETDYNGQLACGLDIISRIDYARRPDRREELRRRILKTINRLIRRSAGRCRIEPDAISSAVISGNTTMIHLLLGLNPEYIRLDPFTPTVLSVPVLTAAEVGLHIGEAAPVMISPAVGSYVGGDITAGLLCSGLAGNSEAVCLFMDIGTNGEVVVGNRDFLLTVACSAGPAFEGGGIKCGMRASTGAVERVEVDPLTGLATARTIGGTKPRGICGSGMISLLAELLKTGWIDAAGKLSRSRPSAAIQIDGRKAAYLLIPAAESATGHAVAVDEQDMENIIRAKAALYAACALMLAEVGINFADLAEVYIAGGFGRFLDLDDAVAIGLLPKLPRDRFHFLGNTSLKGSTMALISQKHREKQQELARRMTYLELTTTPAYMDQYTAALFLPHTDPTAFK